MVADDGAPGPQRLFGLAYGLVALVNLVLSFAGFGSASGFVSILVEVVLAALFLNSAKRLRATRRPQPTRQPTERPARRPAGDRAAVRR